MPPYMNNPQLRRAHEKFGVKEGAGEEAAEGKQGAGKHPHSIHIHHAAAGEPSAQGPHHVHIHHADGSHQHSDHGSFSEAMQHAQSATEEGAALGSQSGAPADGAEMEDGY